MSITKQEAQKELAKRELARRHLDWFIKYQFEGYRENWHHKLITEKLEQVEKGEIRKLMIFVPPRHGKSEIASINFPAWYFGRNPTKSIIAVSYNGELAVGFGRKARNIVASREYQNIFGGITLAEDSKASGQWNTNKGGEYTAIGIGGGATGRGADVFLIDDPVKDQEEANSPTIQERNIDWYYSVARTRLSPNGAMVIIQTRWHDKDLAGQILEKENDWTIISLPAIAERPDEHRKIGEALWESQYPLKELETIKQQLGTAKWASLYQQSPISEESQVFRRTMFKYRNIEELEHENTRCFITIDPAPAKSESSDFIGICINWVDEQNRWNIKAFKIKFDASQLISLMFKMYQETHFEKVGIEKGMYKDVLKPFLDAEMRQRNIFFNVEELDHQQKNKELRIRGLQPRYEAGQIYHLTGYCDDLESELLRFPKAVHDDVSDAVAYQLQIAQAPIGYVETMNFIQRQRERENSKQDYGL